MKKKQVKKSKKNGRCLMPLLVFIFICACISSLLGRNSANKSQSSSANQATAETTSTEVVSEAVLSSTSTQIPDGKAKTIGVTSETSTDELDESNIPQNVQFSDFELDDLQNLYLTIKSDMSYSDALDAVINTGLPYSQGKYNGSREIQVAFTDGCTAQKYKKESGAYLTISYNYPRNENSINDELSKYTFSRCCYIPTAGFELIHSASGNYISELGNNIDVPSTITKEEQLLYYFVRN